MKPIWHTYVHVHEYIPMPMLCGSVNATLAVVVVTAAAAVVEANAVDDDAHKLSLVLLLS